MEEDYGGFKVVREGPNYVPPTPIEGVSVSPSGYAPPQPAQPHPSTPPKVPGKAPKRPPIHRPQGEEDGLGDIDLDFVLDPELDLDTAPMGLHVYPSGEATFRYGGVGVWGCGGCFLGASGVVDMGQGVAVECVHSRREYMQDT